MRACRIARPGLARGDRSEIEPADIDRQILAPVVEYPLIGDRSSRLNTRDPVGAAPQGRIESDGTFRIGGLKEGDYSLYLGTWQGPKGYSLARVERDGAELRGRFPVAEGEKVTGLHVVVAYGTGVIKGQVRLENGPVSDSTQVWVGWRRAGDETYLGSTRADARRQFLIEVVPNEGEYWNASGFEGVRYAFEAVKAVLTGTTPAVDEERNAKVAL